MTKAKRIVAAVLSLAMVIVVFSGCSKGNSGVETGELSDLKYGDTYPIETDTTLTYYMSMYAQARNEFTSYNELPLKKYLEEETGVKLEYIHPTQGANGDEQEFFNLMIASNDLPDLIETGWYTYKGGAQAAINEEIIVPLNELLDKASPNLKKHYADNPEVAKMMRTDEGNYYMYPFFRGDEILMTYAGPMLRKDLLDKAGLPLPETIEEWDTALRAFKDQGLSIPLSLSLDNWSIQSSGNFLGAFGLMYEFYHDGNTVKYGSYDPKFKDYVTLLSKWYADGLLDKDFTNREAKRITSEVVNGNVGAAFAAAGGGFGAWIASMKDVVPEAEFEPAIYPVMNKGDQPFYGQKDFPVLNVGVAISTKCKDVELAARFLDYGYSEKGHMLYNFGREGVSYNMVGEIPTYTPEILDKEKNGNVSVAQAMARHIRGNYNGPFVQNVHYINQFYTLQSQKDALPLWSNTDAQLHMMPFVSLTESETTEYTKIISDINTYKEENLFKFISGKESLDNFDKYFADLKSMGIERAIEIQQAAYDRYLKR